VPDPSADACCARRKVRVMMLPEIVEVAGVEKTANTYRNNKIACIHLPFILPSPSIVLVLAVFFQWCQ